MHRSAQPLDLLAVLHARSILNTRRHIHRVRAEGLDDLRDIVLVDAAGVDKPVAVRFGWHQFAEPNLANKAGLPAIPFRSDNWDDASVPQEQ